MSICFGRLLEVKKDTVVVESYTYDANGNRLTETNSLRGISGKGYSYSVEDHVISAGSDSYQFDVDGFLTSKTTGLGTTGYLYSSRGELLQVDLPDGRVVTYGHDPLGRRISKSVDGIVVEKYLWVDRTTLLAVLDGAGSLKARFTYADDRMPVTMTMAGVTYYPHYDQVGSLRAITDTTGTVIKQIDYDSFGNIISDTNTTMTVPFGFAGGLHDRDTALVRSGFRDYDPAIGRWTAKDPIDFAGGDVNLFQYVAADPVNLNDPWGLEVTRYGRPADLPFPFSYTDHHWIKTDSVEAGMGMPGGLVPAQDGNSGWPYSRTETVDHSGQSLADNAYEIPILFPVDEECVNRLIEPGQPTGRWNPLWNNCQGWTSDVLDRCRTDDPIPVVPY